MFSGLRQAVVALARGCYGLYAWLLFVLLAGSTWLVILVQRDPIRRRRTVRSCARLLLNGLGIRVSFYGSRHLLAARPCLVVANHTSYLDAVIMIALLPEDVQFVAKQGLAEHWITRSFLRAIGTAFVARPKGPVGKGGTRHLIALIQAGHSLIVFPEGTFQAEPGLQPFHRGTFVTAACTGTPVIPLAIRGARRALPEGAWIPRPGVITVAVGEPLRASGRDDRAIAHLLNEAFLAILRLSDGSETGEFTERAA